MAANLTNKGLATQLMWLTESRQTAEAMWNISRIGWDYSTSIIQITSPCPELKIPALPLEPISFTYSGGRLWRKNRDQKEAIQIKHLGCRHRPWPYSNLSSMLRAVFYKTCLWSCTPGLNILHWLPTALCPPLFASRGPPRPWIIWLLSPHPP